MSLFGIQDESVCLRDESVWSTGWIFGRAKIEHTRRRERRPLTSVNDIFSHTVGQEITIFFLEILDVILKIYPQSEKKYAFWRAGYLGLGEV